MSNILKRLSSNFVMVEIGISMSRFNKKYADGVSILAAESGGSEDGFSAMRRLFPSGYNTELNAVVKACTDARKALNGATVPANITATGRTKGRRLLAISRLNDGSWDSLVQSYQQEIERHARVFSQMSQRIITNIQANHALGSTFSWDDYPSPDEILEGFSLTVDGPMAIADERMLAGMPLQVGHLQAVEQAMHREAESMVKVAEGRMAEATLKSLKRAAENIGKLNEWFAKSPNDRGRRPSIFETLPESLRETVSSLRDYAIPESEMGSRLFELANQIEDDLETETLQADDLKDDPVMTRRLAERAQALASAVESFDCFM